MPTPQPQPQPQPQQDGGRGAGALDRLIRGTCADVDRLLSDPAALKALKEADAGSVRIAALVGDRKNVVPLLSHYGLVAPDDWDLNQVLDSGLGRGNCLRDMLAIGASPDGVRGEENLRAVVAAYRDIVNSTRAATLTANIVDAIRGRAPDLDLSFLSIYPRAAADALDQTVRLCGQVMK